MLGYGIRSIRSDGRTYVGLLTCGLFTTAAAGLFVCLLTSVGAKDGIDLEIYSPNRRGLTLATLDAAASFATFGAVLSIFAAVFLAITMTSYFIEGRRDTLRVYALSGATNSQLYGLTLLQVGMISFVAAALGALVALIFSPAALWFLTKANVVPTELRANYSSGSVVAVVLVGMAIPSAAALVYLRGLIARGSFEASGSAPSRKNSVGKVRILLLASALLLITVLFLLPEETGDLQLKVALLTMMSATGLSAASVLVVPYISRTAARPWVRLQPGVFTIVSGGASWNARRIAATASPILLILSLCTMVLVLAESGRAVSIYERAEGMNAQVVIGLTPDTSRSDVVDQVIPAVDRAAPNAESVAYAVDTGWAWTDSRSGIPALARTSSPLTFADTVGIEAEEGSLADITGLGVGTANPRFDIGDTVPLTAPGGEVYEAVVRVKLPPDSFIGQIFLVDWQTFPGGGAADSPKIFAATKDGSDDAALADKFRESGLAESPKIDSIQTWDDYSSAQVSDAWKNQQKGIVSVLAVAVGLGLLLMVQSVFSSIAGRVDEYRSLERCGCTRVQIVAICISDFATVLVSSILLWSVVFAGFYFFITDYFNYLDVPLIPPVPFGEIFILVLTLFVVGVLSYLASSIVILRRLDAR